MKEEVSGIIKIAIANIGFIFLVSSLSLILLSFSGQEIPSGLQYLAGLSLTSFVSLVTLCAHSPLER